MARRTAGLAQQPHLVLKPVPRAVWARLAGGSKPAVLETGATIAVPLFIENGEVIKIDTRTDNYLSRA